MTGENAGSNAGWLADIAGRIAGLREALAVQISLAGSLASRQEEVPMIALPTPEVETTYRFNFAGDGPIVRAMGLDAGNIKVDHITVLVSHEIEDGEDTPYFRVTAKGFKLLKNGERDTRTRGANYYADDDAPFEAAIRAQYPGVLPEREA